MLPSLTNLMFLKTMGWCRRTLLRPMFLRPIRLRSERPLQVMFLRAERLPQVERPLQVMFLRVERLPQAMFLRAEPLQVMFLRAEPLQVIFLRVERLLPAMFPQVERLPQRLLQAMFLQAERLRLPRRNRLSRFPFPTPSLTSR